MKRFFTLVFILSLLYFSLNPLSKTFATESNPGPAGVPQLEYIFSRIVCVTVPIGYIALMVVLIIAGIKYLVSGGETKAVSSAHQTITWGIMGLLFLAISWLILLLIQNFTGIEVTKFSVSSLPGIQGFSGSCWGTFPSETSKLATAPSVNQCQTPHPVSEIHEELGFRVYTHLMDCPDNSTVAKNIGDSVNSYLFRIVGSTPILPYLTALYLDNPFEDEGFKNAIAQNRPGLINFAGRNIRTLVDIYDPRLTQFINNIYEGEWPSARYQRFLVESIPGLDTWLYTRNQLTSFATPNGSLFAKFELEEFPKDIAVAAYEAKKSVIKYAQAYGDADLIKTNNPDLEAQVQGYLAEAQNNPSMQKELQAVHLIGVRCSCADYYSVGGILYSPLIYLYPSNILNVSIKIDSPVNSSKLTSDKKGYWNITASPDGTLITLDGKKYPYIPYEFLRSDFKRPDKGAVVEGAKLEEYLKKDLWKKLGLKDNEIADYWQDTKPRVPQANYYFVSLIEKKEIDRVLPMQVNPNPDTIIRNMTYILPLSKPFIPKPLEEEKLKSPERKGFSVLENGVFVDGT